MAVERRRKPHRCSVKTDPFRTWAVRPEEAKAMADTLNAWRNKSR